MTLNNTRLPEAKFTHMGFWVHNLEKMTKFYQRLFKMHRSDSGRIDGHDLKANLSFLTRDPKEHHQIVLVEGKPKNIEFNVINQISFKVSSLSHLREFWNYLQTDPEVENLYSLTHGNAWSIYFSDPEGNRIELYMDTPWYIEQPYRGDLDFSLTDKEIFRETHRVVSSYETFQPIEEWREKLSSLIKVSDSKQ